METLWLLLLYSLPTKRNTERVTVWRRLKRMGAVQIKTSTYLLPDEPAQYEQFQWLAQQIRDYGGDSTLVRAQEIEGLSRERLVASFNDARNKDYAELKTALLGIFKRKKKSDPELAAAELERLKRQFREIREVDFFASPRGHEVAMLLRRAEGPRPARQPARLNKKDYQAKTWLTRPRPEIDRVGSAWLIAKFIDQNSKFVFASRADAVPGAIPFDMLEAEFSHHGDCCTFETLAKRFTIEDQAVRKIGEMVHDADLDDAKFQRVECLGIDRVFKGWGKTSMRDEELFAHGFLCFDGLYQFLQKR